MNSQIKRHIRVRSGRVPSTGASVPMKLGCTILPAPNWKIVKILFFKGFYRA